MQLLENVPEGAQFSMNDWPLHVTLADVFAIEWSVPIMIEKLTTLLNGYEQATSIALEDALFGPERQTRVTLLEKTPSLLKLHNDVVSLLEQGGFRANNPQFMHEGFLPHSTVQKDSRLSKGDAVTFNAVTLIDMFPGNDPYQRKVLKTIKIGV